MKKEAVQNERDRINNPQRRPSYEDSSNNGGVSNKVLLKAELYSRQVFILYTILTLNMHVNDFVF